MIENTAISVKNLSYSYDSNKILLDNVTFSIHEQSIVTVIGKNGVGKTTLLNCFLGLINNYRGSIQIFGKELSRYSRKELAQVVGLVPQLSQVAFEYTVEEFVLMGCASKLGYFMLPDKASILQVDEVLNTIGIMNLKNRLINSLSGGERQLVYIARTIMQKPRIIVMDEPTSALDFGNSLAIIDLIFKLRDEGYTIILTCHNPDFPFVFRDHTIAIFPEHALTYGKSEELLSDDTLSRIYGIGIKRVYIPESNQYVCVKR